MSRSTGSTSYRKASSANAISVGNARPFSIWDNLGPDTAGSSAKAAITGYESVVRSLDRNSLDAEQSNAAIAALGEALSVNGCANIPCGS